MEDALVKVSNFTQYFRSRDKNEKLPFIPYLRGINLSINQSDVYGIVGESGCGKSTLGKCLVGLFSLTEGNIQYHGREINEWIHDSADEFRKQVQIIFQNPRSALNMSMRVEDLIREAVKIKYSNDKIIKQNVNRILYDMQIEHKRRDYPHQLSGGERRRAGLGRILAVEPTLIIADEPVSSLDVSYKGLIIDLLLKYKQKNNATIVFISHDIHLINQICNRVAVMFMGKVVEIFDNPKKFNHYDIHHPYTQELYTAALFFKDKEMSIISDKSGEFIDAEYAKYDGTGCPYFQRCELKNTMMCALKCKEKFPELIDVNDNQKIACHGIK
ncbi:MAG: ABC transporter ATP-binding protein [Candidatus Marinimicrobia bacterium]|nr:ABC transporter ATP-binding protein [bacterium]MCG2716771.1 ABC transporter ATP-binding protein [Candidatus Neomarinimicrobiota bacterium]